MSSRHASPVFISDGGQPQTLSRLELGRNPEDGARREAFIQGLVHDHPEIIPMTDIEPAMSPLISICRELPVNGYFVDNLWITPWGGLVIGECKLVRNPQARREVVAQVLDYARIMANWSYPDLEGAIGTALKDRTFCLWNVVEGQAELDEAQFVDAVERRLRMGRILLLIIGDGIQEGVEALTSHLQLHAGMHAGMALLDLSIWHGIGGGVMVVPRIPMKTVLIERGIVTLDHLGAIRVVPGAPQASSSSVQTPADRPSGITQSEEEYFDQLRTKRPEIVMPLRAFLTSLGEIGVSPEFRKSAVLRLSLSPDITGSAGFIDSGGLVHVGDSIGIANRVGRLEAAERYLATLAEIVGGKIRRYQTSSPPAVVTTNGSMVSVVGLLQASVRWKAAIAQFVSDLSSALTKQ